MWTPSSWARKVSELGVVNGLAKLFEHGQPGASQMTGHKQDPTTSGQVVIDHALGEIGPGHHVIHPVP
jgi:hypothetical protein